jgi:hypothetical protein
MVDGNYFHMIKSTNLQFNFSKFLHFLAMNVDYKIITKIEIYNVNQLQKIPPLKVMMYVYQRQSCIGT